MKAKSATLINNGDKLQVLFEDQKRQDAFNLDKLSKHTQQQLMDLMAQNQKGKEAIEKIAEEKIKIRFGEDTKIQRVSDQPLIGNEFQFPQVSSYYFEQALKSPNPSTVRKGFEMALNDAIMQVVLKVELTKLLSLVAQFKKLSSGGRRVIRRRMYPPPPISENDPALNKVADRVAKIEMGIASEKIDEIVKSLEIDIRVLETKIKEYDTEIETIETTYASELYDMFSHDKKDKNGNPLFKEQSKQDKKDFIAKKRKQFEEMPEPIERTEGSKKAISDYKKSEWSPKVERDSAGKEIPLAPPPPEIAKAINAMEITAEAKSSVLQQIESIAADVADRIVDINNTAFGVLDAAICTAKLGDTEAEVKTICSQLKSSRNECTTAVESLKNQLNDAKKQYYEDAPHHPSKADQQRFSHK